MSKFETELRELLVKFDDERIKHNKNKDVFEDDVELNLKNFLLWLDCRAD